MGEQLKVSAYGLSTTGKELNLDNMYINGRYVTIGSDTQSTISKVTTEPLQLYGVADSEISSEDRQLGVQSGYTVMDMLQRTQRSLGEIGKIEKGLIWDSMVQASRAIRGKRAEVGLDRLGTSFAGLFLHGNRGLAVHLGDSRIYVIRGGRMLQITDDHLESSDMFRLGILSQAQSEVHKRDSRLTAYMGMDDIYDARDEAFSKYFIFYPGDTFILCSDGISDAIMNDEMERIIRLLKSAPVDQLAGMLMKAAAEKSTEDMTLVVLHIDDAPGQMPPAQPSATIPRRETYDTAPQAEVPAAPAMDRQDFTPEPMRAPVSRPASSAAPVEEPEEEESPSLLDRLKNIKLFNKNRKEEAQPEDLDQDLYPAPAPGPRRGPNPEYEDEEDLDEEPSLLDTLLANPKRLAIIAGIAVAAIVLLIVIISLLSKGGNKSNNSTAQSNTTTTESSVIENSIDITSLLNNESSTLISLETSVPEESSTSEEEEESSRSGPSEETTYTVEDGDTWAGILNEVYGYFDYDLLYQVCEYNEMDIDDFIYEGMILKMPPESALDLATEE